MQVLFRVAGPDPSAIRGELAGQTLECPNQRNTDGRFACNLSSVDPTTIPQGTANITVTVVDDAGAASVATTTADIDYDCPTIDALSVTPDAARPGTEITVAIDTDEPLGLPPRVSRAGRNWGAPTALTPTRYELVYEVGGADPASEADLVVQLTDRAGNTTTDCDADGRVAVAIDLVAPTIDGTRLLLQRGPPGTTALLSAEVGAIRDDVRVETVNVYDAESGVLLASLNPNPDGSLAPSSLGATTAGRVLLEAVDVLGRTSPRRAIVESWSLSLGAGTSPNAALGTAIRRSPPNADGRGIRDRTAELAPSVLVADALRATVNARIGFEPAGQLPTVFEDTIWIAGGYDAANDAIVIFGGAKCLPPNGGNDCPGLEFFDRTLILRWDAANGVYQFTNGPAYQRGQSPTRRGSHKIAFNGDGCGVLFGGYGWFDDGDSFSEQSLSDAWQICHTGTGYEWRPVSPPDPIPLIRRSPIIYDPGFNRYVVVGGRDNAGRPINDVWFLEPGLTPTDWRWRELLPRPTNFPERDSHLVYYDPEIDAIGMGLGLVLPFSQRLEWWMYQQGQLVQRGAVPPELSERQGFGYIYDPARKQVTIWGDNDSFNPPDERVLLLTGTATNASDGWRALAIDTPVARAWPTMVYDAAREAPVTFAGQRFDGRFVPPDIYSMITPPSFPYLLARIDLAAGRPRGIDRLELQVAASGTGDADGVGPGQAVGTGVRVLLWDRVARAWEEVAQGTGGTTITATVTNADRFVADDGVVPMALSTTYPGTESVDGLLEVDQIDGRLMLRSNVTVP